MKKTKTAVINRKLKRLKKNIDLLGRTLATKRGTAALRRGLDNTHKDIDQKFRKLAIEVVKNSQQIGELKQLNPALSEIRENIWHILNRIDAIERRTDPQLATAERK